MSTLPASNSARSQAEIRRILADVSWFHDHNEHESPFEHQLLNVLEEIATQLAAIASYLQPPSLTGVNLMALPGAPVAPGATDSFTATAVDQNGNTDINATVSVASSDPTIVTVDGSSDAGVFTGTWTAVADGSATITGTGNDGSVTVESGADNPASITVATPVVLTAVNLA